MKKILVANRGEIALRVMRSAKEMGIQTVAVYSEADRTAPFVRYADEAVCIGPPPSAESYLQGDKIIEVCKELGVDGIHPGYGFLSENADFTRKVTDAGITFIGPKPEAMELMGDKLTSKETVKKYDIPMVPGTEEAVEDLEHGLNIAKEIGFPVMIKASAGGGGKGMRIVEQEGEFKEAMERAISEAVSAFGNGAVFIEKFVTSPRHIEVQVLADTHGNVVHLHERECSIQRRHQKVIEEAPSAVLTPELRAEMGKCACDVARSCDYVGAGTVEFLLDDKLNFYFLEMNTRLQVEHPVTEFITGLDLVKEQIRVARGEELGYSQDEIELEGHAIEVRVYAEDATNNFLPDIGTLIKYSVPKGPWVRVDDGYEEGMDIPIYYDPMIAKLITYGANREEARKHMLRAIEDFHIAGVATTLDFCTFTLDHEAFVSGKFDTNFVKDHFTPEVLKQSNTDEEAAGALVAASLFEGVTSANGQDDEAQGVSPWKHNRQEW